MVPRFPPPPPLGAPAYMAAAYPAWGGADPYRTRLTTARVSAEYDPLSPPYAEGGKDKEDEETHVDVYSPTHT